MGELETRGSHRVRHQLQRPGDTRKPPRSGRLGPSANSDRYRRGNRKIGAALGAVLLCLLGAGAGILGSYLIAPWQDRRTETATEIAQDRHDASNPGILVQDVSADDSVHGAASPDVYGLDSLGNHFARSLSSGQPMAPADAFVTSTPVSPIQDLDQTNFTSQPRVYETETFTLVGNHVKPVQITKIAIRVVQRLQPPSGTLVYAGPQGGSPLESIGFDLDSTDSAARVDEVHTPGPNVTDRHYFTERQIALARYERQGISATVVTSRCLCKFIFEVTTDDGRVTTVDNHGKPFEISAFSATYTKTYGIDLAVPGIVACDWPNDCIKRFD